MATPAARADSAKGTPSSIWGRRTAKRRMASSGTSSWNVSVAIQWPELEELVAMAGKLTNTMAADPIAHVTGGWGRFRRYAPRMLRVLKIEAAPVCAPLLKAAHLIRDKVTGHNHPTGFLRKTSKWHRHLKSDDVRLWEVAVFFHLRDGFRSGDIWLAHSERFADLSKSGSIPTKVREAT